MSTSFIDERPELLAARQSSDRGTRLLAYLGDVTVNRLSVEGIAIRLPVVARVTQNEAAVNYRIFQQEIETNKTLLDGLLQRDPYLVTVDYAAFIARQDEVDRAYRDAESWTRKSILNAARCGFFSSDRAVRQYCEDIWKVKPLPVKV